MTTMADTRVATQVYQVYIRATAEAIWDALTQPEWTDRYGYRGRVDYELTTGGAYRHHSSDEMRAMGSPDVIIEGEVLEFDKRKRLVQTWNPFFGPEAEAEPSTRLTIELEDAGLRRTGVTRLTVRHELDDAPTIAAIVGGADPNMGGGWAWILSDLKTLLESGASLAG